MYDNHRDANSFRFTRVAVIGSTGSGKSTLAQRLAKKLGFDFIELDALHWEAEWREAPLEVFRERVRISTQAPAWVVAGNYSVVRDLVWERSEVLVWLDYSFPRTLWQLSRRTFLRWWNQEELWNGNRELFWVHFKIWSDESLFGWLFRTYWRRKREIPELLARPENKHLTVMRFNHPIETEDWIKNF